jgi:rhodanese-related sulfurtransferase
MDGEIDPETVESALSSDDPPLVVDIRPPGAFARGHLPGSVNVPFSELPTRVDEVADTDADHVVTVCPHGKASVQAARLVASYEGTEARVESMAGGLEAWPGDLVASEGDGSDSSPPF